MKPSRYQRMSASQLREYVLANRHDLEALREYMNRPGKVSKSLSKDATREKITEVLQQMVN